MERKTSILARKDRFTWASRIELRTETSRINFVRPQKDYQKIDKYRELKREQLIHDLHTRLSPQKTQNLNIKHITGEK